MPRRRNAGGDLQHELEIPFRLSITGGEAALHVRRPTGKTDSITVKIPAGIEDGKKIRLRGQGEPGPRGGKPGDLLITVRVRSASVLPPPRQLDLEVSVPVTLAEAALGAKVDVPTPQGTITLTVPPGTSGGRRLRVKGRGVAPAKGPAGDLYAELRIVLPKEIDEETAQQIRALDARYPAPSRELICNGRPNILAGCGYRGCAAGTGLEQSVFMRLAARGARQLLGALFLLGDRWRGLCHR